MTQVEHWEPTRSQRVFVDWGVGDQVEAQALDVGGPAHRRHVRVAIRSEAIGPTDPGEDDYFIVTLPLGAVHEERDA